MKLNYIMALLIALLVAPFVAFCKTLGAPTGIDALNTQGAHDGPLSRSAEVDIASYLLVTWGTAPATQLKLCTAATRPLGTAYDSVLAGANLAMIPLLSDCSKIMIGSKAIAAGVRVYATAAGQVTDAVVSGAYLVGEAWTACSGAGVEFEVITLSPVVNP